jgi:hypothetical protein
MRNRLFLSAALFTLMLDAALVQSQQLTIQVESGNQTVLTRADIQALPHCKVTTTAFEGVSLKAVLDKAGNSLGESRWD